MRVSDVQVWRRLIMILGGFEHDIRVRKECVNRGVSVPRLMKSKAKLSCLVATGPEV